MAKKTIPTPHADIYKYVTKSGKVWSGDVPFRRKGSTMTMAAKRKAPAAKRPKGGWTA